MHTRIKKELIAVVILYGLIYITLYAIDTMKTNRSANDLSPGLETAMLAAGVIVFAFLRSLYFAIFKNKKHFIVVALHLVFTAMFVFTLMI